MVEVSEPSKADAPPAPDVTSSMRDAADELKPIEMSARSTARDSSFGFRSISPPPLPESARHTSVGDAATMGALGMVEVSEPSKADAPPAPDVTSSMRDAADELKPIEMSARGQRATAHLDSDRSLPHHYRNRRRHLEGDGVTVAALRNVPEVRWGPKGESHRLHRDVTACII